MLVANRPNVWYNVRKAAIVRSTPFFPPGGAGQPKKQQMLPWCFAP